MLFVSKISGHPATSWTDLYVEKVSEIVTVIVYWLLEDRCNNILGVDFMYRFFLCITLYNNLNVSVHQDEEIPVKNPPLLICNALKPRKLDGDEIRCAIAVFEPEDPSKRFMYCKNKVHN